MSTINNPAAGGGGFAVAEIDFGATPCISGVFTVVDAAILPAHRIIPTQSGAAPTGSTSDENELAALVLSAVAGTGQFTLYATSPWFVAGRYKINYTFA